MNGADVLIRALADAGVEVCFANPGTSEMQLVAAIDGEPRMRAILDSRPNFRGSVHRSQYPEDLELKAAGALLAKPPIRNPVVVAMTTTPTRVAACEPAVRSLLNQSQPALIIVSIPDARGGVLLHKLWHLFAIASTALR